MFGTKDGKPLSQHNAGRAIKIAAKTAGLPANTGWHDLKHTCISRWIAAGLDVHTVSKMAGHAKTSTTLDIYTHEFEAVKRQDDFALVSLLPLWGCDGRRKVDL